MTKKRILSFFVALVLACTAIIALASCGEKVELTGITVTTEPTKTVYVEGEKFDPAGMVVTATYSDETTKVVENYTYDLTEELKTSNTKVTITYTEGEGEEAKTVKATQKITVKNDIVSAEIVSGPTKLSYMLGQKFDPTGMQFKLTYENGKVETKDLKDISSAKYNTEALTSADAEFTITIGEQEFKVALDLELAVFIEAETGTTTAGSPSYPSDGSLAEVQASLLTWKEADIKKQNPDMSDADVEAAVKAYEESTQYQLDVEKYHASGDTYLGNVMIGDSVTFTFESDKAGKGDIAFRLASQFILEKYADWNPKKMGDCQFNRICDFYVNGVKYDIPDEVVLPGGENTTDTYTALLWVNWQDVTFEDINFVEGRNVIQLSFKNHGYQNESAQSGYNFTANIDSLIVTADNCTVNPYTNGDVKVEYKASSVKLEKSDNNVNLVIEGTVSGTTGFIGDLIQFSLSGAGAPVISVNGNKFTLKSNVTDLAVGAYTASFAGASMKAEGINVTTGTVEAGVNSYQLVVDESGLVGVVVDSDTKVVVNSAEITAPTVNIEERDGKVCVVVGGGVADYVVAGYTDEEAKPLIEEAIKNMYYTDFQQNNAWGYPLGTNFHSVNLLADKQFEIVLDVTTSAETNGNDLMLHLALGGGEDGQGSGSLDFFPDIDTFEKSVTVGTKEYVLTYDKSNCFGLIYLSVVDTGASIVKVNTVGFEVREDKAYVVFTGTLQNVTREALATYVIDYEDTARHNFELTIEAYDEAAGTFTMSAEITNLSTGTNWLHAGFENAGNLGGTQVAEGKDTITVGGKTYTFSEAYSCRQIIVA